MRFLWLFVVWASVAWAQSSPPTVKFELPAVTTNTVFQHIGPILPVWVDAADDTGVASVVVQEQRPSPTGPTWVEVCHAQQVPFTVPSRVRCCYVVRTPSTQAPQVVNLRAIACDLDVQCVTAKLQFRVNQ